MTYIEELVETMVYSKSSMREAMDILFDAYEIDKTSVFDLVDFLEANLPDLDAVEVFMSIYQGESEDYILKWDHRND